MPVDTAQDTETATVSISAKNLHVDFFMYISPSWVKDAKCTKKFDFL